MNDATNTTTTNPAAGDTAQEPSGRMTGTTPATAARKEYRLVPVTTAMPKALEKKMIKYLRLKAKAGALYGECDELMQAIMAATKGQRRERVILPGVVYKFSAPVVVDNKTKATCQIVDNFAQPEVTAVKTIKRYEVKTWKGDGPVAERPAKAAAMAAALTEEDELP